LRSLHRTAISCTQSGVESGGEIRRSFIFRRIFFPKPAHGPAHLVILSSCLSLAQRIHALTKIDTCIRRTRILRRHVQPRNPLRTITSAVFSEDWALLATEVQNNS
jgi:hypothetical protein